MPKILYIEDQIAQNIPTIRKFFVPNVLNPKIGKKLAVLEQENRIFPQDVVEICSSASSLDIAFSFPSAIKLILSNHKHYEFILIDRNLSTYDYNDHLEDIVNDLSEAGQHYTAERVLDFYEREGDLLLQLLLGIDSNYQHKVYFLTANMKDELRKSENLQTLLELKSFQQEHIIEKGSEGEARIAEILANLQSFKIINDYRAECDILRQWLYEDDLDEFVRMISYYNSDKRREFVNFLRKLLDNLLHSIAFFMGEPGAKYWNEYNKKQLVMKSFIKGFRENTGSRKEWGLEAFDKKKDIGYNSIIRNACLSIFEITSDCGVHDLSKAIDIESMNVSGLSQYTMHSLINQMRDVILWYDKAMKAMQ